MIDAEDIFILKTWNVPIMSLPLPEKFALRKLNNCFAIDWISWKNDEEAYPRITLDLVEESVLRDMLSCKLLRVVERYLAEAGVKQADYLEFYPGDDSVLTKTADTEVGSISRSDRNVLLESSLPEVQIVESGQTGMNLPRFSTNADRSKIKPLSLLRLMDLVDADIIEVSAWSDLTN